MDNFNELTPDETERLAIMAEECGEVIQVIGKIMRHGYNSYHPDDPETTNRMLLAGELGDLFAAFHLMDSNGDVSPQLVEHAAETKIGRMKQYLHHQNAET